VQYSPGGIKRPLAEYVPTAFFEDESVLVFPTPSYEVISSRKNLRGAQVVNVTMVRNNKGRWNVDYDAIRKLLWGETNKKYLYLNVPHNPLGFGYTKEEWEEVLAWAEANDFFLVIDEAYENIRFKKGTVSVLEVDGWEERCIVIQSVSKGWDATGLRFGFIVAHPVVIKAMASVMDVKDSGLFGPSIAMGLWCLKNPQVTEETTRRYRHLHELLAEGLVDAGFSGAVPDAGLCQFMPAPTSADDTIFANAGECAKWLREKLRISVMHREVNGKPYLRWAVTISPVPECELPDEEAVIKEVIRRLKSVTFVFPP
jgi:aspartate/methionine/tyrosine aminotransferase